MASFSLSFATKHLRISLGCLLVSMAGNHEVMKLDAGCQEPKKLGNICTTLSLQNNVPIFTLPPKYLSILTCSHIGKNVVVGHRTTQHIYLVTMVGLYKHVYSVII